MRIAVIGDSITAGVGASSSGKRFTGELQKLLRQKHTDAVVDTYGVGGQTTAQIRNRFTRQVLNKKPPYDTVIIEGGVNDLNNGRPLGKIKEDIDRMAVWAKNRGLNVILVTITPWKGLHTWTQQKQNDTDELNKWLLGKRNDGLTVVDLSSIRCKKDPERFAKEFRSDVVHPNNRGHLQIAREIALQAFGIRDNRPVISLPTTEQKKKPIPVN